MKLVEGFLRQWQQISCNHRWVRARWDDGSYGLRCSRCMAAYAHTWEDVIEAPSAASTLAALPSPAPTAGGDLDRAA